jgi:hypothetical protein
MLLAAAQNADMALGSLTMPAIATVIVVAALIVGAVMNPKDKKQGADETEVVTGSHDPADDAASGK